MFSLPYIPKWFQKLFPRLVFTGPANQCIYITFDDGPMTGVTDKVLDMLTAYNAKATFFCLGSQVELEPELFNRIKHAGHAIGGHSMHHEDGWNEHWRAYKKSVKACQDLVGSKLFRPPYGRIKPSMIREFTKKYKVIMWSVLSGDYRSKNQAEDCIRNVIKHMKDGSIIVFHDSQMAADNMFPALMACLEEAKKRGLKCEAIHPDLNLD